MPYCSYIRSASWLYWSHAVERAEVGGVLGEVRAAQVAHHALVQARCGIAHREVLCRQRRLGHDRRVRAARTAERPGAPVAKAAAPASPRPRLETCGGRCAVQPPRTAQRNVTARGERPHLLTSLRR